MTYVEPLLVEVNCGDDPEFVAADIEDVELSDAVDGVERLLDVGKSRKCARLYDAAPNLQRRFSSRMFRRKVDKSAVRNHPDAEEYLKMR